jgi:hypothetical protein
MDPYSRRSSIPTTNYWPDRQMYRCCNALVPTSHSRSQDPEASRLQARGDPRNARSLLEDLDVGM